MKIMNNKMEEEWCLFQHTNVGHELTKQTSPVYACFPAVPPKVEIQIPCPNNLFIYLFEIYAPEAPYPSGQVFPTVSNSERAGSMRVNEQKKTWHELGLQRLCVPFGGWESVYTGEGFKWETMFLEKQF